MFGGKSQLFRVCYVAVKKCQEATPAFVAQDLREMERYVQVCSPCLLWSRLWHGRNLAEENSKS